MPSTVIGDFEYDAESQLLIIGFVPSGKRYVYFGVPIETYSALRQAPSKGAYFNRQIRDRYDYADLDDRPTSRTVAQS